MAFLRGAADRYGKFWRKAAREPGAETALAEQAVAQLESLKLIRRAEGGIEPRPALFRYAIGDAEIRETRTSAAECSEDSARARELGGRSARMAHLDETGAHTASLGKRGARP